MNHHPRTIDRHLYKERHLIEMFFNKIREYRKIATYYDKLTEVFAAFVCLAASLIWLR
ncbi:transposase [Mailhella massiliensis]|uniref:transposase n=1 Tax=Mailhella massiliensis TaxID=1903261 RepID=UPI0009F8A737